MIRRWRSPKISGQEPATAGFDSYDLRLGDLMRGERATLGKSLLDVQRELKIKASYVSAIENADAKAFETPSFIAGYVRSYARYLGMDPDHAFEVFCRESGFRPTHGLAPQAKAQMEKPVHIGDPLANPNASFVPRPVSIFEGIDPGVVGSVAVLATLVGVLGFGGLTLLKEVQKVDFTPVEQTVGVMDNLPMLGEAGGPRALELADADAGITPPSPEALDRLYRPQALDVPVLIARDGPISTLDPAQVGVLADAAGTAPGRPAPEAVPTGDSVTEAVVAEAGAVRVFGPDAPEVAIFAVRPSWVRVRAANGSVIFEKILDAGEQYVLPSMESAPILRTGNAGSVYFAVNGTAYGPAGEGASVVKNIALAPAALSEAFALADLLADRDLANFIAVAQAELQ